MPLTMSVVVPTYRRPDALHRCLAALAAQTRQPDEVIVVVRDSDVESREVAAGWTERLPLRQVPPAAPGVVEAIAAGLRAVRGDVAAWTDDDAEPLPDWLARLAEWFADPHVVAVGGPDLPAGRGPGTKRFARIGYAGRVVGGAPAGGFYVGPVDHLRGCNMAVRSPVPAPDTRLQGDGSAYELDICLRARAAGVIVYDTRIAVHHEEAARIAESGQVTGRPGADPQASRAAAYNLAYVLSKNTPDRRQRVTRLAFIVGVGQRHSLGLLRGLLLSVAERDPQWLRLTAGVVRAKLAGWRAGAAAVRAL